MIYNNLAGNGICSLWRSTDNSGFIFNQVIQRLLFLKCGKRPEIAGAQIELNLALPYGHFECLWDNKSIRRSGRVA